MNTPFVDGAAAVSEAPNRATSSPRTGYGSRPFSAPKAPIAGRIGRRRTAGRPLRGPRGGLRHRAGERFDEPGETGLVPLRGLEIAALLADLVGVARKDLPAFGGSGHQAVALRARLLLHARQLGGLFARRGFQSRAPVQVFARPLDEVGLGAGEVSLVHEPARDALRVVAGEDKAQVPVSTVDVTHLERATELGLPGVELRFQCARFAAKAHQLRG